VHATGVAFEVEVTRSRNAARLASLAAAIPSVGLALAGWQVAAGPTLLLDGPASLRGAVAALAAAAAGLLAWRSVRALRKSDAAGAPSAEGTAGAVRPGTSRIGPSPRAELPDGTVLVVDAAGTPNLRLPGGLPSVPRCLRHGCTLPGLMLLVLAPSPGNPPAAWRRPTTLLLGRDTMSAESWRRLNVWLLWMERGRNDAPATRSEST
jgi:hypothetical protein